MSTSAFFASAISTPIAIAIITRKRPMPRKAIFYSITAFTLTILALQFRYVAANELNSTRIVNFDMNFIDYLAHMTVDRIQVEDFDHVLLASFLSEPAHFLFGYGFGLGHIVGSKYVPFDYTFMHNTVFFPKSGNVLLLVSSGLIGLILFIAFISIQTPTGRKTDYFQDDPKTPLTRARQALAISAYVVMSIRAEQIAICLIIIAAASFVKANKVNNKSADVGTKMRQLLSGTFRRVHPSSGALEPPHPNRCGPGGRTSLNRRLPMGRA